MLFISYFFVDLIPSSTSVVGATICSSNSVNGPDIYHSTSSSDDPENKLFFRSI